jgi:ribosome maturation factor RimP
VGESPLFICGKLDAQTGGSSRAEQSMAVELDKIRQTAERIAASFGLEVVDVEFSGGSKHRALRVFLEKNAAGRAKLASEAKAAAEHPEESELPIALVNGTLNVEQISGLTHEDCENFSRDFGMVVDVEDLVPGAEYTLEVSSPGLDRALEKAADYTRFRGSLVKLQTFQPVAANRFWQGRIASADGGRVVLDLSAIKQKGKGRKSAAAEKPKTIEIEIDNIEKANLVPEI